MRKTPLVALALAASLVATACGGGSEEAAVIPTTTIVKEKPTTTTEKVVVEPTSALTGLPADEDVLERPVVAVKFDNVEGRSTPQVGINAADVVYEVTVEGGITRFLALYQSTDTGPIGPIRSARGSEIGLLEELNWPLFTWHGANAKLRVDVRNAKIHPRSIDDVPALFYRERGRPAPYNSFARGTAEIRETAPEEAGGPAQAILTFAEDAATAVPSPLAVPASSVDVAFPPALSSRPSAGAPVRWDWSAEQGKWVRFQGGHPHVDGAGEQIAVENLIVRFTEAVDSGTRDRAGTLVPTALVTGEGRAWIFSDGKVATGTWHKPDNETRTTYRDENGDEIVLTPGKTWIALPHAVATSSFR